MLDDIHSFEMEAINMDIAEKDDINNFVKKYFCSLRIKQFFIYLIIYTIMVHLTIEKERISVILVIAIIVASFTFFLHRDHLRKETQNAIQGLFKTYRNENKLVFICNLRKFDGPTFGIVQVDKKTISFTPFRDNLQNEGFEINEEEINNILLSKIRSSLLLKELNKAICISSDKMKVTIQTPEPEKTIIRIKKAICENKNII